MAIINNSNISIYTCVILFTVLLVGLIYVCIGCDPRYESVCANHLVTNGVIYKTYIFTQGSYYYVSEDIKYGRGHICSLTHPHPYPYPGDASAFADTIQLNTTRTIYVLRSNSHVCYYESLTQFNFDVGLGLLIGLACICLVGCVGLWCIRFKEREQMQQPKEIRQDSV